MATVSRKLAARFSLLLPQKLTRRFARHDGGASAVEFALVAVPFFALLFAILETALVFFANQTLQAAVDVAGRQIMTGQAQTAGYSSASYKTNVVCNYLASGVSLFDCTNGVYVDVRNYSTFSAAQTTAPVSNGQFDSTQMTYAASGPGCIQVVTLYYQWPIYVTLLGLSSLANLNGNKRLLTATAVFKNEPYGGSGGC